MFKENIYVEILGGGGNNAVGVQLINSTYLRGAKCFPFWQPNDIH